MKELTTKQVILWTFIGTSAVELVCVAFRFVFGIDATGDTASTLGALTGGLRVHHGYIGLVCSIIALVMLRSNRSFAQRVLIIGLSLLLSDLIHHFIVLWLTVGNPEFYLLYPNR